MRWWVGIGINSVHLGGEGRVLVVGRLAHSTSSVRYGKSFPSFGWRTSGILKNAPCQKQRAEDDRIRSRFLEFRVGLLTSQRSCSPAQRNLGVGG